MDICVIQWANLQYIYYIKKKCNFIFTPELGCCDNGRSSKQHLPLLSGNQPGECLDTTFIRLSSVEYAQEDTETLLLS